MSHIDEFLEIVAIADVIIMVVFNYLNSNIEVVSSKDHKRRTIIVNIVLLIVLLTFIFISKVLRSQ